MFRIIAACNSHRIGNKVTAATLFVVLAVSVTFAASVLDTVTLKNIPDIHAPVYKDKKIWYTINLIFDNCPKNYWVFYDGSRKQLVIEILGVHLTSNEIQVNGTPIIKNPVISNHETDLALNGKKAQIRFDMEDLWHYDEGWIIDGKVLQLKLWMPFSARNSLKERKLWPFVTIAAIAVALITSLVVADIIKSN